MSDKSKIIMKWILVGLAIALVTAVVAGVLYWNRMLNLLGDAEETVPTLSQEEEEALLGTVEPTIVETEPQETWPVVVSDQNVTNFMLVGLNW